MRGFYCILTSVLLLCPAILFSESKNLNEMSREEKLKLYYSEVKEDEKTYKFDRERIKELMEEYIYTKEPYEEGYSRRDMTIRMHYIRAESALLYGDYFSKEEKFKMIIEHMYKLCLVKPYSPANIVNSTPGLTLVFEDLNQRVIKIINDEYGKNDCFRKKMILILAANKVDGREIGDKLIEIFDKDRYNEFRREALEVFISNYSEYYTKEELMPYILKLMKDPYFSICKVCDVVPKKECLGKMKSYPFRDALVPLLRKYNIKFEYIQLDECMIGGVPVLTE
jgi:hypothetical protein